MRRGNAEFGYWIHDEELSQWPPMILATQSGLAEPGRQYFIAKAEAVNFPRPSPVRGAHRECR